MAARKSRAPISATDDGVRGTSLVRFSAALLSGHFICWDNRSVCLPWGMWQVLSVAPLMRVIHVAWPLAWGMCPWRVLNRGRGRLASLWQGCTVMYLLEGRRHLVSPDHRKEMADPVSGLLSSSFFSL